MFQAVLWERVRVLRVQQRLSRQQTHQDHYNIRPLHSQRHSRCYSVVLESARLRRGSPTTSPKQKDHTHRRSRQDVEDSYDA